MKVKSMYRQDILELKDCPFCGCEEIEFTNYGNKLSASRKVKIKCKKCRATMINGARLKGMDWLEDISVDAWNKRHIG